MLTAKSEESILHEASKEIQALVNTNAVANNGAENLKSNKEIAADSKQKELEKQVLTGEITPFQAIEKQSESTGTKGYSIITLARKYRYLWKSIIKTKYKICSL